MGRIRSPKKEFSERDKELLTLIARGCATKEIAPVLEVSTRSVETYKSRLLEDCNCPNIISLVVFAIYKKAIDVKKCVRHV